jgi:hypothetical protein
MNDDLVTGASEGLAAAIGRDPVGGREWGARVAQALAGVEDALRQDTEEPPAVDPMGADEDRALLPSPGVERRAEELRRQRDGLLREVRALRALANDPAAADELARRARDLLGCLRRLDRGGIDLLQESLTPDIGAGD